MRVSGRVAVAVAAVAVALLLEDLIKGDWDWDNRKDAAFERRILFFFERGEIRLSLGNRCIVCVMCDVYKRYLVRDVCYNEVCCMLLGCSQIWIDVNVAQQGSLGAENGLLGRGGAGMPRYVFVYGYIWDCVTVKLFDCLNSGRIGVGVGVKVRMLHPIVHHLLNFLLMAMHLTDSSFHSFKSHLHTCIHQPDSHSPLHERHADDIDNVHDNMIMILLLIMRSTTPHPIHQSLPVHY